MSTDPSILDWRHAVGEKLTTPEEAVRLVKGGDRVVIGMMHLTPIALCRALAARHAELCDISVDASLSTFTRWWPEEGEGPFAVETFFLLQQDRGLFQQGLLDYRIAPPHRQDENRWTTTGPIDVFMTQVSPPDERGYCSFGLSLWGARGAAREARTVIAEVNPNQVRTGGDNLIHVSEIDCFVEATADWRALRPPVRDEEEEAIAQVICAVVAAELIEDGDTLQMGTGKIPAALTLFLDDKKDLGVHTELIFGGIPRLVGSGV
ncbi:MAG: 4-hydroxybutyrate CoA-transferase, partial [Dehalococcoidia bacterium]|nr:4-hydroxybutyrate CoA-transferase [Dehalococcoidia bacterium]